MEVDILPLLLLAIIDDVCIVYNGYNSVCLLARLTLVATIIFPSENWKIEFRAGYFELGGPFFEDSFPPAG